MKRGVKKQYPSSGAIRVISGQFRGRKLPVLDAQGLRPTTDRMKETLFNWLMADVRDSRCLDMFAGSGSLGIEALSRYAKSCDFIEQDKAAAKQIEKNLETLKLPTESYGVIQGDALLALSRMIEPFNVIFVDPPFHKGLVDKAIGVIQAQKLLATDGVIYIECELAAKSYSVPEHWTCIKEKCTQNLCSRLYQAK